MGASCVGTCFVLNACLRAGGKADLFGLFGDVLCEVGYLMVGLVCAVFRWNLYRGVIDLGWERRSWR